ncbi:hypothetical protein HRJ34_22625 [Rhizorhabdus wittichii]|uniref:SMP-30/gluconolactonase/LRE family protein n=1 Tax=Rhizorhabdus wittichii TaxID=160791 RepID=A0A975D1A6_9SPHN|nr:hypothetical protein [Rhizorhabdus wittichii]QTH21082.1 hypothetical protein HRJ34_22625 [Rhizorhabdus wittichii]
MTAMRAEAPAAAEPGHCGEDQICGTVNAEDMVRLDGTDWVITSGMAGPGVGRGGLFAISVGSRTAAPLAIESAPPDRDFASCPAPLDLARFSAHGLSVRRDAVDRYTLFVIGHGGREAVELFGIETARGRLRARWAGCVPVPSVAGPDGKTPATGNANAVAALPDGGIAITVSPKMDHGDARSVDRLAQGSGAGDVMLWHGSTGWRTLAGSRFRGINGLSLMPDGRRLLVSAQTERAIYMVSPGSATPVRIASELGFFPDNIRLGDDGMFYAAGAKGPLRDAVLCAFSTARVCRQAYAVLRIDPSTLTSEMVVEADGNGDFGIATTALRVGDALWLSSFRGDRIRIFPARGD